MNYVLGFILVLILFFGCFLKINEHLEEKGPWELDRPFIPTPNIKGLSPWNQDDEARLNPNSYVYMNYLLQN